MKHCYSFYQGKTASHSHSCHEKSPTWIFSDFLVLMLIISSIFGFIPCFLVFSCIDYKLSVSHQAGAVVSTITLTTRMMID